MKFFFLALFIPLSLAQDDEDQALLLVFKTAHQNEFEVLDFTGQNRSCSTRYDKKMFVYVGKTYFLIYCRSAGPLGVMEDSLSIHGNNDVQLNGERYKCIFSQKVVFNYYFCVKLSVRFRARQLLLLPPLRRRGVVRLRLREEHLQIHAVLTRPGARKQPIPKCF